MTLTIQAISSHPLLTREVEKILADVTAFPVMPAASNEAEASSQESPPRLFLLDACSLRTDLAALVRRCRARSPGSKFLALLSPANDGHAEKIRLFYCGIDGFVDLHESWQAELPLAISSILNGQPWVPIEVLMAYVDQAKALLERQLLPATHLTAREEQVLHLLMRHLTNREISNTLTISERTVKFHVSNILAKLDVSDRNGLSPERLAMPRAADHLAPIARMQIAPANRTAPFAKFSRSG